MDEGSAQWGDPPGPSSFAYRITADGLMTWCTDAVPAALGWSREQLVGHRPAELVHPDDRDRAREIRLALLGQGTHRHMVVRAATASGGWVWLNLVAEAEREDGAVVGALVRGEVLPDTDALGQALVESTSRLSLVVDNSYDVIVHLVDGVVRWVLPSVRGISGFEVSEIVGRHAREFYHPDDRDEANRLYDGAEAGAAGRTIIRLRHRDGHYVWVDVAVNPDHDLEHRGVVLALRDVTREVEARQALEAREAEYRMLAENASDLVVRSDLEGRIDWISPSVQAILGVSVADMIGRSMAEFAHPDDLARRETALHRIDVGGGSYVEARYRRADGGWIWLGVVLHPAYDSTGAVVGRVGSARDITREVEARRALETREAEYRLLMENSADLVYRSDPDSTLEWVSPSVERLMGWKPEEIVGRRMFDLLHPDDTEAVVAAVASWHDGADLAYEARLQQADGTYRWLSVVAHPVVSADGEVLGRVGGARDISEEVVAREQLAASEAMFRSVMEHSTVGMAVLGLDLSFRAVNRALCDLVQRDAQWLLAHRAFDLAHPDDLARAQRAPEPYFTDGTESRSDVVRLMRADGESVWVQRSSVMVRDASGEPAYLVAQMLDLTAERELEFQSYHDALTGLRNREWILDILEEELRVARRSSKRVGVLFVDLDNFKVVNDSLGHTAGDEVLVTVAQRLSASMRPGDHVGRFGGDEFVVVIPDVDDIPDLERICERVLGHITPAIDVQGHRIAPTASMGVAVSTLDSSAQSLLRDADSALYRAKSAGKQRWHFADEAMHALAVKRLTIEDELRRAIDEHQLVVHYQPIVRLSDRSVRSHEALVRWQHPERGLVPPGDFLPVAEDSGLIVELGDEVLRMVCQKLRERDDLANVSVNLSPVQTSRAWWREKFVSALRDHAVDPARLSIEVTETSVLGDLEDVAAELVQLRDLGIGVHVDDFGTGYSSIALLRDLPITGLKLDMSFTRRLTGDGGTTEVLAEELARLANGLGITGIAEGVETEEQAQILARMGWTHAQGWLFGRPAPEPVRSDPA